ncbi:MAG: tRNA pseudouridine(55) synthase TruB [Lachnospiraceae bacterium]|nr:tRNA pseudouridine(55) synthase TruB [Lachnospiraceae bacterium]
MGRSEINGILNIYKEKGFTSFDVVAKLRGVLGQKKIGHTGTLDPMAEGVLAVCAGSATKLCGLLTDADKEYETVLLLGKTTDTQDIWGKVLKETGQEEVKKLDTSEVIKAVRSFEGNIEQIPPMYSAIKQNGKKLYELAREGKTVERKSRRITIYGIDILSVELPFVRLKVSCSKGTYIRTLCEDIGNRLGCGGTMKELLRLRSGSFMLKDSLRLSEIKELKESGALDRALISADRLFEELRAIGIRDAACPEEIYQKLIMNGNKLELSFLRRDLFPKEGERFRIYDKCGSFKGIYSFDAGQNRLVPYKMFF